MSTLVAEVNEKKLNTIIGEGSKLEGRLVFEGTTRISGNFKGEIFTTDVLLIDENAKVEADIEAGTVIIGGYFKGNVVASQRIEINKPAIFKGTLKTPSLIVEDGVIFEGNAQMLQG